MSIFNKEIINTVPLKDVADLRMIWWGTKVELEQEMSDLVRYHQHPCQNSGYCCQAIVVNRYPIEKRTIEYCNLFIPSFPKPIEGDAEEFTPRLIMTTHDMLYEGSLFEVDKFLTPPNVKMSDFGNYVTTTIANNILKKIQKFNVVKLGPDIGLKIVSKNSCSARIELLWKEYEDMILMSPTSNSIDVVDEGYMRRLMDGEYKCRIDEPRYYVDPVHIYI